MTSAARLIDEILPDLPHCHTIHPTSPWVWAPIPHPPGPMKIVTGCDSTVLIEGSPAAVLGSTSERCVLHGCATPGGSAVVAEGSTRVLIGGKPAARVSDRTSHPGCVSTIAAGGGKIIGPGATTVSIGD